MREKTNKRQQLLEWTLAVAVTLAAMAVWEMSSTNQAQAGNMTPDAASTTDPCQG